MKTKPFRKPRIRKFGDISRLTHQIAKGGGTQAQGADYDVI